MKMPDRPRRLGDLLRMRVRFASGNDAGFVNDVRVLAQAGTLGYGGLVVDGIIVADRHVGSLLGYERRREQGPWILGAVVRFLHRRAGYVEWSEVDHVDWDGEVVVLRVDVLGAITEP
jgi:hypothetical protein